jgi:chorismate mutase-like protein
MEILKPYRERIDQLDRQILDLLRARFDIIDEVAILKKREGIDAVLPDRVDAVRENAAHYAAELGLDVDFVRMFWTQLIDNSCQREDKFIHDE